jgi:hypothetical protein
MCLNETYSKVRTDKNLTDVFSIQNGLKQGVGLLRLLFNFRTTATSENCIQEETKSRLNVRDARYHSV